MVVAGQFAPTGYAECDGRILQVAEHRRLFELLGKKYGGDGVATFALPDLRGRLAIGSQPEFPLGRTTGVEAHTMSIATMPRHAHSAVANVKFSVSDSDDEDTTNPVGAYLRRQNSNTFSTVSNATMGGVAVTVVLQDQGANTPAPMPNIMPSVGMIFCISLRGPFPPPT